MLRASTLVDTNLSSILHQKNYFFLFYTSIFTKHSHQFIYFTHLFNKIFILFYIFYYFLPSRTNSQTRLLHRATPTPTPILQQNHPHPTNHCLLRRAIDLTQTQNHPNPATSHHQRSNRTNPLESPAFTESRPWIARSWSVEKVGHFHVIRDERG